jgi:hypothetical protein
MFDTLPDSAELRGAADDAVVAAIGHCARVEAAAAGRRLAAIAELVARHADGPTDSAHWSCDNWDAMAAEVAAALGISQTLASGQMYQAVALRHRLPRIGALLAEGAISARLASAIVWHTDLIKDTDILARVDAALAADAARFGPLTVTKTAQAIDAIVDRYDPAAVRRTRMGARNREVVIAQGDGESGTAALWGRLFANDAAVLDRRLTQMAHQVCDDDPRTLAQRRADALGTLAAGGEQLACGCGKADCPARLELDPRAAAVVIHVVADPAALQAAPDPHMSGERQSRPITADMTLAEALAPDPEPDVPPAPRPPAAHLVGGGTVPAPLLAELIGAGAALRPVHHPANASPEPGYRPSGALARFIRCRDMTCRFPGCDRPAECADVDHTVPYPFGPTHASNLKCLCRKHHLLKTFWTGWRDEQWPDGTIVWTSPTGQTYTTRPDSRLLFPSLCLPTSELPTAATPLPTPGQRGIMMPTRRRTRAQDRARRIDAERALNRIAGLDRKAMTREYFSPATYDADDEPPPF